MFTPDRILTLGRAFMASKALLSAVELDVFTALAAGPLDFKSLKNRLGLAERGARDFLDALVALGLLERDPVGCYRNAPDADNYLDRHKPSYVGGELRLYNQRQYPHWDRLTAALLTGESQSQESAIDYFPTMYADRAKLSTFAQGMTGGALLPARAIAANFPWAEHKTFADIGTAQGCLPVVLAQAHPHLTGIGFDLTPMKATFESYVCAHALADRLRFVAGNFLTDALPKADVIVLGRILHNWDLATKKLLLRRAHDALPPGGAVIVYERLIDDERRTNATALLASLNMLIMTRGGFDYTGADCCTWMQEADFRNTCVEPIAGGQSMIVALK
jgi:hypothetical protein